VPASSTNWSGTSCSARLKPGDDKVNSRTLRPGQWAVQTWDATATARAIRVGGAARNRLALTDILFSAGRAAAGDDGTSRRPPRTCFRSSRPLRATSESSSAGRAALERADERPPARDAAVRPTRPMSCQWLLACAPSIQRRSGLRARYGTQRAVVKATRLRKGGVTGRGWKTRSAVVPTPRRRARSTGQLQSDNRSCPREAIVRRVALVG